MSATILRTSRSLRWNLPNPHTPVAVDPKLQVTASSSTFTIGDSPNEEDATLCYATPASDYDLTACASTPVLSPELKIQPLPFSKCLDLLLPQLPEIPDWYDDDEVVPHPVEILEPVSDTPQSDYHSCFEYQYTPILEAAAPVSAQVQAEGPARLPSSVPNRPQHRRRSYSLDSAGQRPLSFSFLPDAGLGIGLASPFSLSPSWAIIPIDPDSDLEPADPDSDTDAAVYSSSIPQLDLNLDLDVNLWPSPTLEYTQYTPLLPHDSPNVAPDSFQSPPGLRRNEALAVWRPAGPIATYLDHDISRATSGADEDREYDYWGDDDDDDVCSLEQPFPSSASIWVLDRSPPRNAAVRPLPQSASWPAARVAATRTQQKQEKRWTLEEQITIALLAAASDGERNGRPRTLSVAEKEGFTEGKTRLGRMLGRIRAWRGAL
ncbi:hypothetical protein FB45DRAFT_1059371 [Roridomyces roridus]|uniref:Uncharacterized protein n=1 Tax=Roridomyces roridus TaxID=1738132 RepID=A0AAD7BRG5_9AGAR|nr:hypothetical protein FB45DRAFT_1059371 [Roridomyces roridus]